MTSFRVAEKIEIGEKKERIANVLNGIALRSADYLAADDGAGDPGEGEDAGREGRRMLSRVWRLRSRTPSGTTMR